MLGVVLTLATAAPGAAFDGVEPASSSQCPAGQFCVWSGAGYTGTMAGTSGTTAVSVPFGVTRSVWNRSAPAARIYSGSGGTGVSVCFAPGAQSDSVQVTSASMRVLSTTTC